MKLLMSKQEARKVTIIEELLTGIIPAKIFRAGFLTRLGWFTGAIAERLRTQAVQGCTLDASALAVRRWSWEFACRSFF
jgi:hypothetical protein